MVAVNDGVITKLGESPRLGRFVVLTDAYGNRYTYAQLGEISDVHPVPKQKALTAKDFEIVANDKSEARPGSAASAGANDSEPAAKPAPEPKAAAPVNTEELRERLFALPERPANVKSAGVSGQLNSLLGERVPGYETFKSYFSSAFKFDSETMELRALRVGSKVTGGTVLGRIGQRQAPALRTSTSRSSPPAAARRGSTRSRSLTAGSCWRRPRSTAPPARTRSARRRRSARSC